MGSQNESLDDKIKNFFKMGLRYKEILSALHKKENFKISLITLKRKLRKIGLFRKINKTDLNTVVTFIEKELAGPGKLVGYRWMHRRCVNNELVVDRKTVSEIVKILDPEGVEIRKKKRLRRRLYDTAGSNALWHADGYDKIKPYGLPIHGGIDGFSRYVLWLQVGTTNNKPEVISGYYANTLQELQGFPICVRSDLGTENVLLKEFQEALKEKYRPTGTHPAHLYGPSTNNQRIEAFWEKLRRLSIQFYMNTFEKFKQDGKFNGSHLDKEIIRYCFLRLVQEELDQFKEEWNSHRIRKQKNCISPTGCRPFRVFTDPERYGKRECLVEILDADDIETIKNRCIFETYPCDKDIYDVCEMIVEENYLKRPSDPASASALYLHLREEIYEYVERLQEV